MKYHGLAFTGRRLILPDIALSSITIGWQILGIVEVERRCSLMQQTETGTSRQHDALYWPVKQRLMSLLSIMFLDTGRGQWTVPGRGNI